jgi:hypothetical protein
MAVGWLPSFVSEVAKAWPDELAISGIEDAEAIPKLAEIIGRRKMNRVGLGTLGEKHVADRLKALGMMTALTPGSRTPADVFGARYNDEQDLTHISLVQVKTTYYRDSPARLSSMDVEKLGYLAEVVFNMISDSSAVPRHIKESYILVSTGYAGLKAEGGLLEPNIEIVSSGPFEIVYPTEIEYLSEQLKGIADAAHRFGSTSA